ncbi:MAG: DUF4363 family protein [Ruminococcaceae bacterium]|nr:DUF4363 family protein [Oscillospiraceae bacterium]
MSKTLLPPLAVLLAMFAFALQNGRYMGAETDRWQTQLHKAEVFAWAEDWESAAETLQDSYRDWTSRQVYLHIVTEHDVVDDAESMYQRAMAFAAVQEDSEFRAELADLRTQLQLLAEMERFSLKNIL